MCWTTHGQHDVICKLLLATALTTDNALSFEYTTNHFGTPEPHPSQPISAHLSDHQAGLKSMDSRVAGISCLGRPWDGSCIAACLRAQRAFSFMGSL